MATAMEPYISAGVPESALGAPEDTIVVDDAATDADENMELMRAYIMGALGAKIKGDSSNYDYVIEQMQVKEDEPTLRNLYMALASCAAPITAHPEHFHSLLQLIFKFDWHCGYEVAAAYTHLLTHLVSSNGTYLLPSVQSLVRSLVPTSLSNVACDEAADDDSLGDSQGQSEDQVAFQASKAFLLKDFALENLQLWREVQTERARNVHGALRALLGLAPSGVTLLFNALCMYFPHKRLDRDVQTGYVHQLLRVAEYVPALRGRIVALIIEKMVEIDVEIKLEENEDSLLFAMDDIWNDVSAMDGASDQADPFGTTAVPHGHASFVTVDEMADKLDGMMCIMFDYIREKGSQSPSERVELLELLFRVFDQSLLNTHRSKYTQFLLFYACQLAPSDTQAFVQRLLAAVMDEQLPAVTRQSAMAYLASFLARGSHIPESCVRQTLTHLATWAVSYSADFQRSARGGRFGAAPIGTQRQGMRRDHRVYYTVTQSSRLAASKEGHNVMVKLPWNNLLVLNEETNMKESNGSADARGRGEGTGEVGQPKSSRDGLPTLNPLRNCLESVRREFLYAARILELLPEESLDRLDALYLKTGQESAEKKQASMKPKNKTGFRSRLKPMKRFLGARKKRATERGGVGGLGSGQNPLDSFFPFDPYLLRRSHSFIAEMYFAWRPLEESDLVDGVSVEEDSDDAYTSNDDESEGEGPNEEEDEESAYLLNHEESDDEDMMHSHDDSEFDVGFRDEFVGSYQRCHSFPSSFDRDDGDNHFVEGGLHTVAGNAAVALCAASFRRHNARRKDSITMGSGSW